MDWVSCAHLKEELNKRDKISFNYESIPNNLGQKYFAIQAAKVYEDENDFYILLGFRFVDDILVKEKAIQEQLEDALDKTKKQNEIISAIAKTFNAIYRVDIINDKIEEIASDDISRHLKKDVASASEQFNYVCDNLVAPEYRELVRPFMDISTLEERLKDEEFVTTEYKMNDGNWHRMRFVAKRKDASGRLTHVLCLIRIISDTKRTEENLYFEAEQAKKEVDMKTQFLKTMSHDIRTPLNGLIGMIKMADQYSDDVVMRSKLRNKAQQSLEYLVSLVNDILDMNKLQSGDLKDQQLTFDFINFLRELNHIYYDKSAEKGIKYDIDWENVKFVHSTLIGNPVYLGRALSNIASNAVKFSPSGSTITVWGNEEIIDDKHSLYTLYCKDEGEGMTDEFIKHAFGMFSQQNQTSRTKYEGSGLGLAMSKKLIERMGGSIKLESKKGVGTTAIIKVPFELGDTDTVGSIDYENVPTKGVHALLVDDNELNIEIAKFFLEDNGMEVTCAYDGKEAVDIFEKSEDGYFGVIYMDILMPNMNGLDATREIRALNRKDAKKVPIIAVSANTFSDDVFESRKAGMNKHLGKPLDEEKMIKAYKQCAVLSEEPIKLNGDL
ncbi:MAG: response regulator [Erysipelotrichaceae bacterium]|nr:response regulator [Solobacterium sp.]MDY3794132.1 response regulator [Erysipelotrichaceae bacterium]